ncbi:hypothetical protein [Pandoraea sp. SD6-2]|uniref:hypothetical protein n=1 Tax=Pandoraea sp. SD6-2 TaxID=1286093 RepID=UPI000330DA23|nr:hypothetical protein [Pandoraea sp. SD6-2]EON11941.1 hypothetical protein C266_19198 [Pandoraea sp. SD6-2]
MIETWKAWVMLAFGVLVGAVLIYVWPWPLIFVAARKDWVEVTAAFGTVGATIAAVVIAIRSESKSRRQGETRASIVAVMLSPKVRAAADLAQGAAVTMAFRDADGSIYPGRMYSDLSRDLRRAAFNVTSEELAWLSELGGGYAFQLARGVGLLETVRAELDAYPDEVTFIRQTIGHVLTTLDRWRASLTEADRLLTAVDRRCKREVARMVRVPSNAEHYGEPGFEFPDKQ